MKGVTSARRTATFTAMTAIVDGEVEKTFIGQVRGQIIWHPRVECQKDMPYSAIFQPDGSNKTWAEMTVEEENAKSHRGQAFRQVREFLISQIVLIPSELI